MDDIPHADLLEEIRVFCARKNMPAYRFGGEALGDYGFVKELEAGRDCRRVTVRKVRAYMAEADPAEGKS